MTSSSTRTQHQSSGIREEARQGLGALIREFPWVHLTLGLIGNTMFFVGSILFFFESTKNLGIWLFVIGSLGMLLGSLGEFAIRIEKKRRDDL